MAIWKRREFLGASIAGLSAGLFAASSGLQAKTQHENSKAKSLPAGPDTLFLTWRQDPTTTMMIQWVAPAESWDKQIEVSELDADHWRKHAVRTKPYPNTDLKVFRCELTGLTPGTEYKFRVGSASGVHRFRTMPAKATNVMQFVSGGDSGVNEHALQTNLIAAKQEPRFVLMGGDLAYDNGRKPETFTQFLRNYRAQMVDPAERLIPMISCPGNHEVDGGYNGPRTAAPQYLSVFDALFEDTTYGVLDIGDYMSLVLLDTGHISPIEGAQTDWLEKTLSERQDRPHLIVANHVPAYPSYRSPNSSGEKTGTGEGQRKHWCPLFEKYKVDVVLEHHDHMFKRTFPLTNGLRDKNGVLYLGDGSWGQLRASKEAELRPYLAALSSSYHMTVHRIEGEDRFHVALDQNGKIADVCHTGSKRPSR